MNKELEKLAIIQRELINVARRNKDNTNITIKIRNGIIVWAEADKSFKKRIKLNGLTFS